MSKKKMGKKRILNRKQFLNVVCNNCKLCDGMTEAAFCFDLFYKKSPELFGSNIAPRLIKIGQWPTSHNEAADVFEEIFCKSGICEVSKKNNKHEQCPVFNICLSKFINQLYFNIPGRNLSLKSIRKAFDKSKVLFNRKSKKKKKFVVEPYPTFFSNGGNSEWFMEVIKSIDGDDNCQQNKDKAYTGSYERDNSTRATST